MTMSYLQQLTVTMSISITNDTDNGLLVKISTNNDKVYNQWQQQCLQPMATAISAANYNVFVFNQSNGNGIANVCSLTNGNDNVNTYKDFF